MARYGLLLHPASLAQHSVDTSSAHQALVPDPRLLWATLASTIVGIVGVFLAIHCHIASGHSLWGSSCL